MFNTVSKQLVEHHSSASVNKEIGFYCILEYNSIRFITPQNFGSGVFFYVNCDKINIMIIGYQV